MKNFLQLITAIGICELVGLLATPFTIAAIPTWYATLHKPFFSPPNWVFGPVWTALYALMGISFFLIFKLGVRKREVQEALIFFFIQLVLNFFWSISFFGLRNPLAGLITIILLLIFIVITMWKFYPLSKTSFALLIPYLVWVSFATILNASILLLN